MDAGSPDPGARRRALLRAFLGKPGSVRRWLAGSLLFFSVCALLYVKAGFLGRIAVFLFASLVVVAAFRARSLLIGDEDEFRAALKRETRRESKSPEVEALDGSIDAAELGELLRLRDDRFSDVPAPPSADDDALEQAGRGDTSS